MKYWQKDRNYRKHQDADGTLHYVITVDGEDVEVTCEVYEVYARSERKLEYMERDLKRDRVLQNAAGRAVLDAHGLPIVLAEREVSLEKLVTEGWDYPASEPSPEAAVLKQLESETLYCCLEQLDPDEQILINALFFDGLTEVEYARTLGVKQQSVNERKHRILIKMKKLLG